MEAPSGPTGGLQKQNNVRPFLRFPAGIGIALIIVSNLSVLANISLSCTNIGATTTYKWNKTTTEHQFDLNNSESTQGLQNWSKEFRVGMDFWWMSAIKHTMLALAPPNKNKHEDNHQENSPRALVFPNDTKRLWIDVGVHKESDFMGNLKNESDLFLIGFEPSQKWSLCPHPRCATLWAACTPTYDASVTLNIQDGDDLCNSILPPQTNTSTRLWKGCVTQKKTTDGSNLVMNVPGIPLSEVIQRVPSSVVIEFVKIDAQGFDLEVMKGLLSVSDRVQIVVMEAMDVSDPKQLLYVGQPMLSQIVDFLAKKGWKHVTSISNPQGALGEVNAFFVYNDQYAAKVEQFTKYFLPK